MNLVHVVQVKNTKNAVEVYKKVRRETKKMTIIEVKISNFLDFIIS